LPGFNPEEHGSANPHQIKADREASGPFWITLSILLLSCTLGLTTACQTPSTGEGLGRSPSALEPPKNANVDTEAENSSFLLQVFTDVIKLVFF